MIRYGNLILHPSIDARCWVVSLRQAVRQTAHADCLHHGQNDADEKNEDNDDGKEHNSYTTTLKTLFIF